jgi:superfamily I DNA/RNA helicase
MFDMIRRAGLESLISNKGSFDEYPALALKSAEILGEHGCYDSLIIDESQDVLTQDFLDVLSYLLKDGVESGTWRIFIDPNQDIFHGLDLSLLEVLEELSNAARFTLSINCRNTRQISYMTGILSDQGRDAEPSVDGPDVDHIWYDNTSDARRQISRIISRYISDGVKHTQIAILSDRLRANSCLAQGLDDISFRLVEPNADELPGDGQIGYYTVQSFKGLEAEVIILIDLENICTAIAFSNNYVGASRARTKLTVALQAAEREPYELLTKRFGERMAGMELSPMSFAST